VSRGVGGPSLPGPFNTAGGGVATTGGPGSEGPPPLGSPPFATQGLAMAPGRLRFEFWVMLAVALACLPIFVTGREIARWEGVVFLLYYACYVAYLILAAQKHAALEPFSTVMMSFVIPITVITLIVVLVRKPRTAA